MGKSYSSTNTNISDDRLITGEGSVGVTGQGNALSISDSSTTIFSDQGAIAGALDVLKSGDVLDSKNYELLLTTAERLFDGGSQQLERSSTAIGEAYQAARESADNPQLKTLAVIAVIGVAVVALFIYSKKS